MDRKGLLPNLYSGDCVVTRKFVAMGAGVEVRFPGDWRGYVVSQEVVEACSSGEEVVATAAMALAMFPATKLSDVFAMTPEQVAEAAPKTVGSGR